MTLLTAELSDPFGYGRIVRDESGAVREIVEGRTPTPPSARSTSPTQRLRVRRGVPRSGAGRSETTTPRVSYLTDVVEIARGQGRSVGSFRVADVWQTAGVNDRSQLAALGAEINRRTLHRRMLAGVTSSTPAPPGSTTR